jgi:hypothetical protein
MILRPTAERARPEQRGVDLGQVREAWGHDIRLSLRSTAHQPLYTRLPILSRSCVSKVIIGFIPSEAVAALAGGVVPADRLELLRRRLQRPVRTRKSL